MNRFQRMQALLDGQPVDRPPVCFWHHFGPIGPENTVKEHLRFYRESGVDLLKMMCDEFFIYPMNNAKTDADYLALRPQGKDSYYVRGQVERAAQINEALHGEAMTLYNAFSPYATLKHALGDLKSMTLLREHRQAAKHVLEIICEDTCSMVEGILKESGTAGMMIPLQGAEFGRFDHDEYEELVAAYDRPIIDLAQKLSNANLLHICGWDGVANHLEWVDGYDTRMVNWACEVEKLSVKQARARFPDRILMGGFDNREGALLHVGTKEEIQTRTRRILWEAGSDNLILGADCSIPADTDPAHIRWVIEALEET